MKAGDVVRRWEVVTPDELIPLEEEIPSYKGQRVEKGELEGELPEELELILQKQPDSIPLHERWAVKQLFRDYKTIFALKGEPLGHTDLVEHKIHVGETVPIRVGFLTVR